MHRLGLLSPVLDVVDEIGFTKVGETGRNKGAAFIAEVLSKVRSSVAIRSDVMVTEVIGSQVLVITFDLGTFRVPLSGEGRSFGVKVLDKVSGPSGPN
jgi:hypothetical protein